MSDGSADCPVPDCGFSDIPSLVAAHVNGTSDADHDWDALPFDGPGAFLSAARSDGPTMPSDADPGEAAGAGEEEPEPTAGSSKSPTSESAARATASEAEATATEATASEATEAEATASEATASESGTEASEPESSASDSGSSSNRGSRAIAGDPEPLPVRCPVDGCDYTGPPKSVAAHVSGKRDAHHDMRKIDYPNAEAFPRAVEESADSDAGEPAADPDHPFDDEAVREAAQVALETADDVDALDDLPLSKLVDLHVAFSVLSSEAGSARRDLKAAIVDRVDEDGEIEGRLGAVERSTGTRRSLRDEAVVQSRLLDAGIDPARAQSFDADLVAEAVEDADADVDESELFETRETDRLRRADVNEAEFSSDS